MHIGFLPPENGTGRGMGHVSYTVQAKPGLPTGAQIRNIALISFDNLPSIATNQRDPHDASKGTDPAKECLNTIDAVAPTSLVQVLPSQSPQARFQVTWSGQDDAGGSGVASFDIYVSDNGGVWTAWLSGATGTTNLFSGQPGHTYAFFSQARDHAGNLEPIHALPDAVTTAPAEALGLDIALSTANLSVGDKFTYTLTLTNRTAQDMTGLVVNNQVPVRLAVQSIAVALGSYTIDNGVIVWTVGNLPGNAGVLMTVTATAMSSGRMTNSVTVKDGAGTLTSSSQVSFRVRETAPALTVALTNQQVVLSWPEAADGFELEMATSILGPANWVAVTNAPAIQGDQKTVTVQLLGTSRFYRLKKP